MATASTNRSIRFKEASGALHVMDVARQADVTPATVRYYARIGLLNPDRDDQNGYRRFTHEDLQRLQFIRKAQGLGLTIADIRSILTLIDDGRPVCTRVVRLLERRLQGVRRAQADLEITADRIEGALRRCAAGSDSMPGYCPLIDDADT